jgi:zinc transporter 5/7
MSSAKADERQFGEENVVADSLVDACLYAFSLTSVSFLAITAGHRIQQNQRGWKGKSPVRSQRQRQHGDLSLASTYQLVIRISGLALPFISATQLGGITTAMILILGQSIPLEGAEPMDRISELAQKSRQNTFKLGLIAIMSLTAMASASTGVLGIIVGFLALFSSMVLAPLPSLSVARAIKSRFDISAQSNPLASLIAAGRDRIYIPSAGYTSAALALFFYFISPSQSPFGGYATPVLLLSALSTVAVVSFALPLNFSTHSHLAMITSSSLVVLSLFLTSSTASFKFIQLSFVALAYAAVRLDQSLEIFVSHGETNKHHQHGEHSRFTGHVLKLTTPGSIIHTIISERDSRRIAYFGV